MVKNNSSWTVGNGGTTGKGVGYTDKNTEIERTKSVLDYRTKNGMDTSAQQQWYKKLTGSDWSTPQQNTQNSLGNNANQNQYKFQTYDANSYVANENYLNKAREYQIGATKDQPYKGFVGNQYNAGSLLDESGLNELAYYLELNDKTISSSSQQYMDAVQREISKGYGLSDGWTNNYDGLSDLFSQRWAIEDFIADKYGINSMSDMTVNGLGRGDLGFLEAGKLTTLEERLANGIQDDPWGINSSYFNDPRNKGQQFAYMNYFDPMAYAQQNASAEDGRGIEYWYNTNFAREHGYEDENWNYNINNFSDWRDLSHDAMVGKYGVGGTHWGGTEANLQAYQNMINNILNGTYVGSSDAVANTPKAKENTNTSSKTSTKPATSKPKATEREEAKDTETARALQRYLNGMWGGGY